MKCTCGERARRIRAEDAERVATAKVDGAIASLECALKAHRKGRENLAASFVLEALGILGGRE